jgi:hypothetical protein
MPRHQRLLLALWEQRKYDPFGGIGWRGLMDEDEQFTPEQLYSPLLERGLVEDCREAHQSENGKYFVRITPLGIACMSVGYMLRDPRPMSGGEMKMIVAAKDEHDAATGQAQPAEAHQ